MNVARLMGQLDSEQRDLLRSVASGAALVSKTPDPPEVPRSGLGAGYCACGRRISTTKESCLACKVQLGEAVT